MSYDLEVTDRTPPKIKDSISDRRDLEGIVMLMELAAIYLTPHPGAEFTLQDLMNEARTIGGPGLELEEADVEIVLDNAAFLKKDKKKFSLR